MGQERSGLSRGWDSGGFGSWVGFDRFGLGWVGC
jgi:hypothetical protein